MIAAVGVLGSRAREVLARPYTASGGRLIIIQSSQITNYSPDYCYLPHLVHLTRDPLNLALIKHSLHFEYPLHGISCCQIIASEADGNAVRHAVQGDYDSNGANLWGELQCTECVVSECGVSECVVGLHCPECGVSLRCTALQAIEI